MRNMQTRWLFGCAIWLFLIAITASLIVSQWKHETLPLWALAAVIGLTIIKARIVILDFMGLRGERPRLAAALIAWPALFTALATAKAAIPFFLS